MNTVGRRGRDGLLWGAFALVTALQLVSVFRRPVRDKFADLQVYVGSVQSLLDGASLYDYRAPNGDPFTYPPFAGLVFTPVALLDEPVGRILWSVATIIATACVAWMTRRSLKVEGDRLGVRLGVLPVPLMMLALLLSSPGSSNIRLGQVSLFLVVLVMADCLGLLPSRIQGVGIGLAGAIKLTPLVFVPYLWLSGRRKAACVSVVTFLGAGIFTMVILPNDSLRYWSTEIFSLGRIGDLAATGNQSINGILMRIGLTGSAMQITWATLCLLVVVAGLIGARRAALNGHRLAAVVITGATGVAISPVSWTHHQYWVVIAAFVVAARGAALEIAVGGLMFLAMVVPFATLGELLPTPAKIIMTNFRGLLIAAIACGLSLWISRRTRRDHPVKGLSATFRGRPGADARTIEVRRPHDRRGNPEQGAGKLTAN